MKKLAVILSLIFGCLFLAPAHAANVNIDGLPAASSNTGTDLWECEQSGTNRKCTSAQGAAYIYGLMTGDCTTTALGAITCTKTNGSSFGGLATTTPGTGVATAAGNNLSAAGGLTTTVGSTTLAMATSAIASGSCTAAQTATVTGTATTDVPLVSFNGDPTGVTGFAPTTNGMLTVIVYPTANTVNIKECNNTTASITPGAHTFNIRVLR